MVSTNTSQCLFSPSFNSANKIHLNDYHVHISERKAWEQGYVQTLCTKFCFLPPPPPHPCMRAENEVWDCIASGCYDCYIPPAHPLHVRLASFGVGLPWWFVLVTSCNFRVSVDTFHYIMPVGFYLPSFPAHLLTYSLLGLYLTTSDAACTTTTPELSSPHKGK